MYSRKSNQKIFFPFHSLRLFCNGHDGTNDGISSGVWNPVLRKTLSHPDALHSNRHKVKSAGDQPDQQTQSSQDHHHSSSSTSSFMSTLTSGIPTLTASKSVKMTKGRSREGSDLMSKHAIKGNVDLAIDTRLAAAQSTSTNVGLDPVSAPVGSLVPGVTGIPLLPPRKESKRTFLEGFRNPLRSKKSDSSKLGGHGSSQMPPSPTLVEQESAADSLNVDMSSNLNQSQQQQLSPGAAARRWSECGHPKT